MDHEATSNLAAPASAVCKAQRNQQEHPRDVLDLHRSADIQHSETQARLLLAQRSSQLLSESAVALFGEETLNQREAEIHLQQQDVAGQQQQSQNDEQPIRDQQQQLQKPTVTEDPADSSIRQLLQRLITATQTQQQQQLTPSQQQPQPQQQQQQLPPPPQQQQPQGLISPIGLSLSAQALREQIQQQRQQQQLRLLLLARQQQQQQRNSSSSSGAAGSNLQSLPHQLLAPAGGYGANQSQSAQRDWLIEKISQQVLSHVQQYQQLPTHVPLLLQQQCRLLLHQLSRRVQDDQQLMRYLQLILPGSADIEVPATATASITAAAAATIATTPPGHHHQQQHSQQSVQSAHQQLCNQLRTFLHQSSGCSPEPPAAAVARGHFSRGGSNSGTPTLLPNADVAADQLEASFHTDPIFLQLSAAYQEQLKTRLNQIAKQEYKAMLQQQQQQGVVEGDSKLVQVRAGASFSSQTGFAAAVQQHVARMPPAAATAAATQADSTLLRQLSLAAGSRQLQEEIGGSSFSSQNTTLNGAIAAGAEPLAGQPSLLQQLAARVGSNVMLDRVLSALTAQVSAEADEQAAAAAHAGLPRAGYQLLVPRQQSFTVSATLDASSLHSAVAAAAAAAAADQAPAFGTSFNPHFSFNMQQQAPPCCPGSQADGPLAQCWASYLQQRQLQQQVQVQQQAEAPVKRKRGRPRKHPLPGAQQSDEEARSLKRSKEEEAAEAQRLLQEDQGAIPALKALLEKCGYSKQSLQGIKPSLDGPAAGADEEGNKEQKLTGAENSSD